MKYPWLAAALNFVLPGAGYLYLGVRIRFGTLLIAATVLSVFAPTADELTQTPTPGLSQLLGNPGVTVIMVAGFMVAVAFAYDAYSEAGLLNMANSARQDRREV